MNVKPKSSGPILLLAVVVITVTSPIWMISHFAVQDGSAHIYNGYLLAQVVRGNASFVRWLQLNTFTVPNSTGHWIIAVLVQVFSIFTAQKVMLIGTYLAMVAGMTWMRYRTRGTEGFTTAILLSGVLGLNWFWFGGFFNFSIGVAGFIVVLTLFYRWRDDPGFVRLMMTSLILLGIFLSHIVPLGMAAGGLFVLAFATDTEVRKRNLLHVAIALLPSVAFAVYYRSVTSSAESIQPVWRWLSESNTLFSALRNFLVDPFIIISRKTLPFTDLETGMMALLSPGLWTAIVVLLLAMATIRQYLKGRFEKQVLPFAFLFAVAIVGALAAPDDFGLSNGGILRERVLLCGLCMFVPVFSQTRVRWLDVTVKAMLIYVLVFQTLALWNYGSTVAPIVEEFASAQTVIENDDHIASIVNIADGYRFHSVIEPQLGLLTSTGKKTVVYDNYELGHYLFPLVTRSLEARQFIRQVAISHAFVLNGPGEEFNETLKRLDEVMTNGNDKFTKVIVWDRNEPVDRLLEKWFEPKPIFESGRVRVLRHR